MGNDFRKDHGILKKNKRDSKSILQISSKFSMFYKGTVISPLVLCFILSVCLASTTITVSHFQ